MGKTTEMTTGGHSWNKQNMVTITTRTGQYDVYKCKCGLEGKRYGLTNSLHLKGNPKQSRIDQCELAPVPAKSTVTRIRIIKCAAFSKSFENITPGSEHDVVPPPKGHREDGSGVWVMGTGEAVKVLYSEFKII